MTTKLDKPLQREIEIDGEPFTVTLSPHGIRLTRKRFRSGVALSWKTMWDRYGDAGAEGPDQKQRR